MDEIFLKKTCYQIKDNRVEQKIQPVGQPKSLIKSINLFETGQVYEVIFRDAISGFFVTHDQMINHHKNWKNQSKIKLNDEQKVTFLISIVNKQLMINGEKHTLTFFKDITFGVLYDQIKSQEELKNMINNTLQTKIGVPIRAVVQSCVHLQESEELVELEKSMNGEKQSNLRDHMERMMVQCKSVIYRLNDMQDWQLIIKGQFRRKNISFKLNEITNEINSIMQTKAAMKKVEFQMNAKFEHKEITHHVPNMYQLMV